MLRHPNIIVQHDPVLLGSGPREQHQRPCINGTFRSAALAYGERVIGVLLTGTMNGRSLRNQNTTAE